jgi:hypothetical protein
MFLDNIVISVDNIKRYQMITKNIISGQNNVIS